MWRAFQGVVLSALVVALLTYLPTSTGQQGNTNPNPTCTSEMLGSFTPCMNYVTGSSSSGTSSPTLGCCTSLKSLMSSGLDCLCQIVMGGVPFKVPINRNLAISLPKACNHLPGVPIQCKASPGAPLPAPGPAAFSQSASPAAADSPGPSEGLIPVDGTPAQAPTSDTASDINPSTTVGSEPPASSTTETSSTLTPSAAVSLAHSLLVSLTAVIVVINYL